MGIKTKEMDTNETKSIVGLLATGDMANIQLALEMSKYITLDFKTLLDGLYDASCWRDMKLEVTYISNGKEYKRKGVFRGKGLLYCGRAKNSVYYKYVCNMTDIVSFKILNFNGVKLGSRGTRVTVPTSELEMATQLQKKFNKNLWSDIQLKLDTYINGGSQPAIVRILGVKPQYRSIRTVFAQYSKYGIDNQMKMISDAIENGERYIYKDRNYSNKGNSRSKTIEVRANGEAYYHTELVSGGKEIIYYIINATTMVRIK